MSFDTENRMAEIVGKPQRIEPPREEDLAEASRKATIELREAFGIPQKADVPEVLLTMLRHPGLFHAQVEMGKQLGGRGTIPPRDRELAILRNAWLCGAPYEWGEHVDIGKRLGVTAEEIERCTQGSQADGWSEHERALLRGVEELLSDYMMSDETWAILAQSWDEQQLMEFPVLIGHYVATAMQQNSLRMRLAHDNPGLGYR